MEEKTVEWTRPDLDPEYVHLRQQGRYKPNYTNPLYKQRTFLFEEELSHGNISLKLLRVRLSDEGTYRCSAINPDIPLLPSSSEINLHVAKPEDMYIPPHEALRPNISTVKGPFIRILWKNGPNNTAVWHASHTDEFIYSGSFHNRTKLDKENGHLVINDMTLEDYGTYSVEIYGQETTKLYKTYMVKQMKKVPKPEVLTKEPCGSDSTSCEMHCTLDGDITESGTITYLWRKDGGDLMESGPRLNVTKDVKTLTCGVKNEFSSEESDPVPNRLHEGPPSMGPIAGGCIGASIVVLIGGVVLGVIYREPIRTCISHCTGRCPGRGGCAGKTDADTGADTGAGEPRDKPEATEGDPLNPPDKSKVPPAQVKEIPQCELVDQLFPL